MAPRRRPIYRDEDTSSDDMSDSTYQPVQPLHKRGVVKPATKSMADEIVREGPRKRGRGPSKRPCLNRNAQMARENRQKKKEYIEKIESKLLQLQHENKSLNTVIQQQNIDIKKLNADVAYLKSVLNNKSSITLLLRSMNQNLEKIRRKSHKEAVPPAYPKDPLSDLEPLDNKLFNDEYRIKLENGAMLTNNGNYKLLADAYRMNNNVSKIDEDHILDDTRQEESVKNFLPFTPDSFDGPEGKTEQSLDAMDFNDLTNFSGNNIFNDLPQLDDVPSTLDFDEGACTTIDDDFFQGLEDNAGICLHVNPSRVSLEFCSSCQMNSANSVLE